MSCGRVAAFLALCLGCGGAEKPAPAPEPASGTDDVPTHHRAITPDDDDDDDGLQVSGLRGHLDTYDIQRGVEPFAQKLSACYNREARRRRYLGGSVRLDYLVATSGEVKAVRLGESDLGSWPVERCLLEVAAQMSFARPKGGEAEFSLPLDFAPTRPATPLDDEATTAQLEPLLPQLDECATESEAAAPSDLTITAYVGARGAVQSVGFASDDEAGIAAAWADCAATKIKSWTLADPMGRIAKLSFSYK